MQLLTFKVCASKFSKYIRVKGIVSIVIPLQDAEYSIVSTRTPDVY